jgi:hypothetical protein
MITNNDIEYIRSIIDYLESEIKPLNDRTLNITIKNLKTRINQIENQNIINDTKESFISQKIQTGIIDY